MVILNRIYRTNINYLMNTNTASELERQNKKEQVRHVKGYQKKYSSSSTRHKLDNCLNAQKVPPQANELIPVRRIIKRIGCKNSINSFNIEVDQTFPLESKLRNQSKRTDQLSQCQDYKKKYKRLGKKHIIKAYHQQVSAYDNDNAKKTTIIRLQNKSPQQNKIQLSKYQLKNDDEIEGLLEVEMANKMEESSENKGYQVDVKLNNQLYVPPVINKNEIILRKVSSEQGILEEGQDSFSINVNKVSSTDIRGDVVSIYQKSDKCLQSLKSDSEGVSHSVIVHGELQKLLNQSQINSNTQNQNDSKIQQLIEQIQKNYNKNTISSSKITGSAEQNRQKQNIFGQHLEVPSKKFNTRQSVNVKKQEKKKLIDKQSKIIIQQQKVTKQTGIQIQVKTQPDKQENEKIIQKSQQQKLMQFIDQKNKQKKKKIVNKPRNSIVKGPRASRQNKKKKSTVIKQHKQNKQNCQEEIQSRPNKTNLGEKEQELNQRLLLTQVPKKTCKQQDGKMSKSNLRSIKSNTRDQIKDIKQSHVHLKTIQMRPSNNSVSLHQSKKTSIKNQSTRMQISKYKKNLKVIEQQPGLNTIKKNHKELQVSQYVNLARKLVSQSLHI